MFLERRLGNIGIVGVGVVGGFRKTWFEFVGYKRGVDLFLRDYKKGYRDSMDKAKVIFVSVCPPANKPRQSTLAIVKSIIRKLKGSKIVVINSTLGIGYTFNLQKEFCQHVIFFNPEFIWMPDGLKNTINPERQIVAPAIISEETKNLAEEVLAILPKATMFESPSKEVFLSSTEAETVKLLTNFYISQQVDFSSVLYKICNEDIGVYKNIMEIIALDKRISSSHLLNPKHGGYLGWGGHCLIKDAYQLADSVRNNMVRKKIMSSILFNKKVLTEQGLKEEDVTIIKTSIHSLSKKKGVENAKEDSVCDNASFRAG